MPRAMQGAQIIGQDCKSVQSFVSLYHSLLKAKCMSFKSKKLENFQKRQNKSTFPAFMKSQRSTSLVEEEGRKKKERP